MAVKVQVEIFWILMLSSPWRWKQGRPKRWYPTWGRNSEDRDL